MLSIDTISAEELDAYVGRQDAVIIDLRDAEDLFVLFMLFALDAALFLFVLFMFFAMMKYLLNKCFSLQSYYPCNQK